LAHATFVTFCLFERMHIFCAHDGRETSIWIAFLLFATGMSTLPRGCNAVRADRFAGETNEASDEWNQLRLHGLEVQFWTWNSDKADLTAEAWRLFQSPADVLITCQTEAKAHVAHYVNDQWAMVSYAKHAGIAGGQRNAQVLSVFVRQNKLLKLEVDAPNKDEWKQSSQGMKRVVVSDALMEYGEITGVVKANTRIHETSSAGKGGASVALTFHSTAALGGDRDEMRLNVLCAHLDAASDEKKRVDGLTQMLAEMRSSNRQEAADFIEHPDRLFYSMNDRTKCPNTPKDFSHDGTDNVDTYAVLGDLNFRLPALASMQGKTTENQLKESVLKKLKEQILNDVAQKLATPEGRLEMAAFDPLSPYSNNPAWLVQSEEENGFAFTCNRPFEFYMPTYKLQNPAACSDMARHIANWSPHEHQDAVGANHNRIKMCYQNKGGLPLKDSQLQLGWLDRMCIRHTHGSSVKSKTISDEGWISSDANDHMAVAVTVQISSLPRLTCCSVTGLPEHSILMKGGTHGPKIRKPAYLLESDLGHLSCMFPRALALKDKALTGIKEVLVNCDANGVLIAGDKQLSDFECKRQLQTSMH